MSKNVLMKACKFCQDVGKPEIECTNHRVKDINGKTICPTLLNTECRYCFKLGHTTKYCDVLAKHKKQQERTERNRYPVVTQDAVIKQKKVDTAFAGLYSDSDSEEEPNNPVVATPKPAYLGSSDKEDGKTTWADVVSKAKVVIQPKALIHPKEVQQPKQVVYAPWATSKVEPKKSWADWSDSEDEDEY
jgi:hypothetical protein